MDFKDYTIQDYVNVLGAKDAVPGGGGASAIVGALGIALGKMVGSLTVGKKKYAEVEADMYQWMEKAENLQKELLACADEDAKAFEPLSKAYAIPKDDPTRGDIMEQCLKQAAQPPLKMAELCCQAIELHKEFGQKGSVLAISDAATGAAFCKSALLGAAVNVKVNTKSMQNRDYAEQLNAKVDEMLQTYGPMADEIYENVVGRLS